MRHFTALLNPVSGSGRASETWRPVAERLRAQGHEVDTIATQSRRHAIDAAATAAESRRVAVAVGGDGLVRDVAGGASEVSGTVAIVPAGRGNDLARFLGVPSTPDAIAGMLRGDTAHPIDLVDVNGIKIPGNVYIGIDSTSNRIINANRWMPSLLVYRLAPVQAALRWKAAEYTIEQNGRRRSFTGHTIVMANSGIYGHGLRIVPPARLDDGKLHVMTVGDIPKYAIAGFMKQAKHGAHVNRSKVDIDMATELVVDANRSIPVCADGDEITTLPATVKLCHHAITLIAPRIPAPDA